MALLVCLKMKFPEGEDNVMKDDHSGVVKDASSPSLSDVREGNTCLSAFLFFSLS